ncbi:response regulator transcription factor [bacterium]
MGVARILVVDDEPDILLLIKEHLNKEGFTVLTARTADAAIKIAKEDIVDLVVLDLELGGISGWDVCKILREEEKTKKVPIIMITAKHIETDDIVKGLEIGADDYVVKPFKLNVLQARINAILRRKGGLQKPDNILELGKLKILLDEHKVYFKKKEVQLTPKEFNILAILVKKKGRALNRAYLTESIWGYEYYGTSRTIDKHVENLRKKLGSEGDKIETIEGVGYRFNE